MPGLEGDRTVDEQLFHLDVLPTLADFCGLQLPDRTLDGRSFAALLEGEDKSIERGNTHFTWGRGMPQPYWNMATVSDTFKLYGKFLAHDKNIPKTKTGFELYDLQSDPKETKNIAQLHPQKVLELQRDWDAWLAEMLDSPALQQPLSISLTAPDSDTIMLTRQDCATRVGSFYSQVKGAHAAWYVYVDKAGHLRF